MQATLSEYRILSEGMKTKPMDEFRILSRLDKNTKLTNQTRKEFDNNTMVDLIEVFNERAKLKEVQIGFIWELRYNYKNKNWSWNDKEFAYNQIKECFEQLIPLYRLLRLD